VPEEGFYRAGRTRPGPNVHGPRTSPPGGGSSRRPRWDTDAGITDRDVAALRWLGQQYGARADVLRVLLGRLSPGSPRVEGQLGEVTLRDVLDRWEDRGLVARDRLLGHLWVAPTVKALRLVGLDVRAWSFVIPQLAHVHAVGVVRLALEPSIPAGGRWLSERELRREAGKSHVPDGAVQLPDDPQAAAGAGLQRRRTTRTTTTTTATRAAIHTTTQIHSGPISASLLCLLTVHERSPGTPTGQRPQDRLGQGRTRSAGSRFVQRRRVRLGRGPVGIEPRLQERRLQGFLLDGLGVGLGELDRPSPGQRARPPRQPGARAATPSPMDQQPFDRVRGCVQGGLDRGQPIEALPAPLVCEGDLQDHAPAVLVPGPVDRPVGQGRLDQGLAVGVLPSGRRDLAVEDLNGPPLHGRYGNPAQSARLGAITASMRASVRPPPAHRQLDGCSPQGLGAGTGLACGAARGNPAPARGPAGCLLDGLPPRRLRGQGLLRAHECSLGPAGRPLTAPA
jgi:hypothetical protein